MLRTCRNAALTLLLLVTGAHAEPVSVIQIAALGEYVQGHLQLTGIDYVIDHQGWLRDALAKRGVKFEWYPVSNSAVGPLINEGFAAHKVQFAGYGDLPAIILNGNGGVPHTQLLVPGGVTDAFLVVPNGSSAKSILDLKGKRLAIHKGRPWELPLLHLLDSKHLSYGDFQIYNINPEAGAAAVVSGAVDGLFTIAAYGLQQKHLARIIWSTKDAPLEWKMGIGFWGDRDFINQHPDLTQIVVNAYVKAAQWASQDANRGVLEKLETLNGTTADIVRLTDDDPNLSWKDRWSPRFSPWVRQHYQQTIAYASAKGIIRSPINSTALLDDRFVNAALNTLSLQTYWTDTPVKPLAAH